MSFVARLLGTIVFSALLGFPMGIPFPSLMRLAGASWQQVALIWAINGAFSVLGSTLALVISMLWGFKWALLAGALAYLLLIVVVRLRSNELVRMSMIEQTLRDRLVNAYLDLIPLITLNVLWFVCSIPLVTLIPATGALFYGTNRLAHGKPAGWREFFEGFRICFRRSWGWGIVNLVVAVGLFANYFFYQANWLHVLVFAVAIVWLTIQVYNYPLLLEQEQPHLRLALRNSLVLIAKRPLFTLGAAFVIGLLMVGTTIILLPAWMMITASVCAFVANLATLDSIAKVGGKPKPPEDEAGTSEVS